MLKISIVAMTTVLLDWITPIAEVCFGVNEVGNTNLNLSSTV
jgi:hypothetical protein